ncbi:MAG TPA: hypothetical protein VN310_14800 [Candidatus Dormibacteraeota bacterium]|jgi:hypothetical protein|nr:hypothetical protein [Candidatus Dormibacteraeota bacterium]
MGPIALFDKSFLQSLSLDEAVFFDRFFLSVICPLFYVETLADLEKHVREGRTPEQEVGIIADKVPEMSGYPCAYHIDLGASTLFGANIPLNGRIPTAGGRPVNLDGKSGFVHEESAAAQAFRRWQEREFLVVERQFARTWRTTLNNVDLARVAAGIRAMGITPGTCRSLEDAKVIVDRFLDRDGAVAVDQLNLAIGLFEIPPEYDFHLFGRWATQGRASLRSFAPFAAHVVAVELFFRIALGAALIGTADANNRTDIGYLFYTPFCHVFVSSDNLHRRCAPHFLRTDQSFVWGHDLKADLNRLMNIYTGRPEEEKEQGLMRLAPTPPPDDHGVVAQLWDSHFGLWRQRATEAPQPRNPKEDAELLAHINRLSDAPAMPRDEMDFDPADAQFVQIQRRVTKRRGGWWQLPKDLKG